ncbi:agarase [Umezawaea sp. NPDC059074]|uniref:agarase n=1 Tax=Umezawaea sp. NPDC059074 TaxID=3346716 RepID=UPI0036C07A03
MRVFDVGRDDRWRLRTPDGDPFLSIGVVHADDTNLRYPHNSAVFADRYGSSRRRWIAEGLVPDLRSWGFTTIGWTSEYVSGTGLAVHGRRVDIGHSEGLSGDDLASAGVPYTLSLRVAEIERWNGHPAFRDPRDPAFAQWCDHLARTTCRPDDPNLLGYFLVDGPAWSGHPAGGGYPEAELAEIAGAYYRVAAEAIRRHDPHHLVLGDRYGTVAGVPDVVLDAMAPHVDVLSVQTFPGLDRAALDAVTDRIDGWHERTGRPVLIADTGNWCPTTMSPDRTGSARDQAERGVGYAMVAENFAARPWCLGWHWCGWVENPHRGFGLKDPWDEPYRDLVDVVTETNARLLAAFLPASHRDAPDSVG